jgi:hypothetical protein
MKKIPFITFQRQSSILFFLFFLFYVQGRAQNSFLNTPLAWLGQQQPGDTPVVFAKDLLVDSGIVLGRVAFSSDGKEFYYGFAQHWFDGRGSGVKRVVFDGVRWKRPEIVAQNLHCPTFSIDGNSLYFNGPGSTVWKSERKGNGWTTPVKWLDEPFGLYNFMPARSGNFYVGRNGDRSTKNDYTAYDFSVLTINGNDTVIKSLGEPLNTSGFDGDFYISPDESYIIISAKEHPTFECELWLSFRKKDGSWSNPVSLGPLINTGLAHRFGQYVSPNGKYLFYTMGTSEKDCHFYWVRWDTLLKKLRQESGL